MPSPFPGMDPYLESPDLWPDVHHELISQIRTLLNPNLRPNYVARVELRVYISDEDDPGREVLVPDLRVEKSRAKAAGGKGNSLARAVDAETLTIPFLADNEIKEAFLEIRHRESGSLVTLIEVLSPANKIRGSRGRASFLAKRNEVLGSEVHWVEIDLLRAGAPSINRAKLARSDYRLMVSHASQRLAGKCWLVSVRQRLPVIGIPLRAPDADVSLDLNEVLAAAYENASYDLSIDYRRDPDPALIGADRTWARRLLRARGLR